jgi:hypothetical protein
MHFIARFIPILILIFCTGCGSRTFEDLQEEGKGVIRSIIQELQLVKTREELLASSGMLQGQFDRLATIMIKAEELGDAHPEWDKGELSAVDHELSDRLRIELNRIYRIEGGRQIIEKCQEKGLHRLDAFERKIKRK